MPKAPAAGPSKPSLRRNQACRSCRKRKLKCDAQRPHCTTCVKQWQALISVPAPIGYAHPSEPQCSYDPVEGLTLAPDTNPIDKIKQLENEVSQLKSRLIEQQGYGRPISPAEAQLSLAHYGSHHHHHTNNQYVGSSSYRYSAPSAILGFRSESISPRMQEFPGLSRRASAMSNEMLYLGWNPDLPDPQVLNHLIDIFFRCDPCGSRILHRPSFLASMHLPPRDPNFPHSVILHAICASASRWSPATTTTAPDGTRRDQFAEYHANKARSYVDKTMVNGEDIFSVVQACVLLAWYFYQEGRWVEVWIFAGFQTRVSLPLRLNYPGTFSTHANGAAGPYLAPPKDFRDLESRRRTWWMTIIFDRIVSVGGWSHGVDEQDIGTELPLRAEDFEAERGVPSNRQDLASPDIFTTHPLPYTDSFILLIKSIMLFGRVTDFNVRGNLRAPTAPSKNQNPFYLQGFTELDNLVCNDFMESLPHMFKNNSGVTDAPGGSLLDTDLYMVHIIPHAAAITLHNPYLDFTDLSCTSALRCTNAAQCIIGAYYILSATSLDITRLHPFVIICWYLAAVVQVQLCKYFIEIGDTEKEATVWGEINVLRNAMLSYGVRSPIGIRQERLLQGLMKEIVRLTAQQQPLEVGVPLYPFSHDTLFRKGERREGEHDKSTNALLPTVNDDDDSDYEEKQPPPPPPRTSSSHSHSRSHSQSHSHSHSHSHPHSHSQSHSQAQSHLQSHSKSPQHHSQSHSSHSSHSQSHSHPNTYRRGSVTSMMSPVSPSVETPPVSIASPIPPRMMIAAVGAGGRPLQPAGWGAQNDRYRN